jgi:hypothetical protein
VASAIADPLTVTPKKSLLVFIVLIGVSFLSVSDWLGSRNRQAD